MSSLKDTVDRLKSLEVEKLSLIAQVDDLRRLADAKADGLAIEINALKEELNQLMAVVGEEKHIMTPAETLKEKNFAYMKELAAKTLNQSDQLGNQVFSASPFSQNFTSWLANLQQIALDFESNLPIKADEQYLRERQQVLLEAESALAKKKAEESNIAVVAKSLAESNHFLAETDKDYAEKARELSLKRDAEVQRLNDIVQKLERQVQIEDEENKRKILKKKTTDTIPQTRQNLKSTKDQLDAAQKNFTAEQDKLHVDYEKKKQDLVAQVESLRQQLAALETDTSLAARQTACRALADSVNAMVNRASGVT